MLILRLFSNDLFEKNPEFFQDFVSGFCLESFCVSCEMLCPYKLLLLLLWFFELLLVALIQVFRAVLLLVALVGLVKMLQPAVSMLQPAMSTSARLLRALLWEELLSDRP